MSSVPNPGRFSRAFILLLGGLAAVCLPHTANAQDANKDIVRWRTDYNLAREESSKRKRPMLIYFHKPPDAYGLKFEQESLNAPKVAKLINDWFVPLKLDGESGRQLGQTLGVDAFPTVIFATSDGKILIPTIVGYQEPEIFHKHLEEVLEKIRQAPPKTKSQPDKSADLELAHDANKDIVRWRTDYKLARQESGTKKLPILIYFETVPNPYCDKLNQTFFRNPRSAKLINDRFIPLRLNGHHDSGRFLGQALDVEAFPTVIFATSEGKIVFPPIVGCDEPEVLHRHLEKVLKKSRQVPPKTKSQPSAAINPWGTVITRLPKLIKQNPPPAPIASTPGFNIVNPVTTRLPKPIEQTPPLAPIGSTPGFNIVIPMKLKDASPAVPALPKLPALDIRQIKAESTELIEEGKLLLEAVRLSTQAKKLVSQGKYDDAETPARAAADLHRKASGEDDVDFAVSLRDLAEICHNLQREDEAALLHRRALKILEAQAGKDSLDVALSLNLLARVCLQLERYPEAEALTRRSLRIREVLQGRDHLDVASCCSNLGTFYLCMKRYKEAEPALRRALEIREDRLSTDNADFFQNLTNLGTLYVVTGRFKEAVPPLKRCLSIQEAGLGLLHPDLSLTLVLLGKANYELGLYADAEPFYRRVLAIKEKQPGKRRPDFVGTLNSLAATCFKLGRLKEAESFFKRGEEIGSLHAKEVGIGERSTTLQGLAEVYRGMNCDADAEIVYKRYLNLLETVDGKNEAVAACLERLAKLYWDHDRHGEAVPLLRRCVRIREANLGRNHARVASSLGNLAFVLMVMGRLDDADAVYQRCAEIHEARHESRPLADTLQRMSLLYLMMGRTEEAEALYNRSMKVEHTVDHGHDVSQ